MTCTVCGQDVSAVEALTETVYESAYAEEPTVAGYCSPQCLQHAESSEWAADVCEACGRFIALHDASYDLRDARALQFVTDPAGRMLCRRCAGVPVAVAIPW